MPDQAKYATKRGKCHDCGWDVYGTRAEPCEDGRLRCRTCERRYTEARLLRGWKRVAAA